MEKRVWFLFVGFFILIIHSSFILAGPADSTEVLFYTYGWTCDSQKDYAIWKNQSVDGFSFDSCVYDFSCPAGITEKINCYQDLNSNNNLDQGESCCPSNYATCEKNGSATGLGAYYCKKMDFCADATTEDGCVLATRGIASSEIKKWADKNNINIGRFDFLLGGGLCYNLTEFSCVWKNNKCVPGVSSLYYQNVTDESSMACNGKRENLTCSLSYLSTENSCDKPEQKIKITYNVSSSSGNLSDCSGLSHEFSVLR